MESLAKKKLKTRKAGLSRRFAAFFIDYFLFVLFLFLSVLILSDFNYPESENSLSLVITVATNFILFFLRDVYSGVSFGKWIMGLRILGISEKVPSTKSLIVRNLFLIVFPVEFVLILFNVSGIRLGDKFANTIVVNNYKKANSFLRFFSLGSIVCVFIGAIFLMTLLPFKNSDPYKAAIFEIEKNEGILKELDGIEGYGFIPSGRIEGNQEAFFHINVFGVNGKEILVKIGVQKDSADWLLKKIDY